MFFHSNRGAIASVKDLIRLAYGDPPSPYRRLRLLGKAFGVLSSPQGSRKATSSASRPGPAVPVRHLPLNRSLRSLGKAFGTRQRLSLAFPRWGRCPHGRRPSEASRGRMRSSPGFASFFYCNRGAKPSANDLIRLAYGDPPSPKGKAIERGSGYWQAPSSDLALQATSL